MGEPVGRLADIERDGCGVGGNDTAGCGATAFRPGGVGRDAAPADRAGETELIEPAGIVVGDARRQQGALPLDGRRFKAFQLMQRLQHAFFSGELGLRREVLPTQQPAQVGGGGDRLNLLARRRQGQPVDALENAALAPLDLVVWISFC